MSKTLFKLNYGYYVCILFKKDINSYSRSKLLDQVISKLNNLSLIYQINLFYTQDF